MENEYHIIISMSICLYNTHISLFLKSHHFGKCFHLKFLYIIGYNNILWRHHSHSKIKGVAIPRIDAYDKSCTILYYTDH